MAQLRPINPDNVIACVLFYLNDEFTSDPTKLHTGFKELAKKEEYGELLKPFVFVNAYPFSYSPLLERVLQRLQEAKLLSARNPDFVMYEMSGKAKKAVKEDVLPKFDKKTKPKLSKMASELKQFLELRPNV